MTEFTLPAGPSTNLMYRAIGSGRVLKSREYRTWLRVSSNQLLANGDVSRETLTCPVAVSIVAHPKDHRFRDLDNYCKAILDLLEFTGIIKDDKQVTTLSVHRGELCAEEHRVTVTVHPMEVDNVEPN